MLSEIPVQYLNTLRQKQNGCHFADNIFKCLFFNENVWIFIKISLTFVPMGPINDISALVQIIAWRRPGDKPLSEPMMDYGHICVTWPQWVNQYCFQYDLSKTWICNFFQVSLVVLNQNIPGYYVNTMATDALAPCAITQSQDISKIVIHWKIFNSLCHVSVQKCYRIFRKYKYIFQFPKINSALQGLIHVYHYHQWRNPPTAGVINDACSGLGNDGFFEYVFGR